MSLTGIAKSTLEILDKGGFTASDGSWVSLEAKQHEAITGTRLYTPDQLSDLVVTEKTTDSRSSITVCNNTTQQIAKQLVVDEGHNDLVLLNFASARNAGGGFINGAKAQEEDLCRCSGLYPCLTTQPRYYEINRQQESLLYSDHMIYSPKVPWFRVRNRDLLDSVFTAAVITAPAPNAGQVLRKKTNTNMEIEQCLRKRCGMVLAVARDNGHRTLLLGAWGCGVFSNNPATVADAFATWLESETFAGDFDLVVFAVLDRSKSAEKFRAFKNRLTSTRESVSY